MRIAYFDCFSGVAGDMIIGALLDAGLDFDDFKTGISRLGLSGYDLHVEKITRNLIAATRFNVRLTQAQPERRPDEIIQIISDSKLDNDIKKKAIEIFTRLAQAEADVHGETLNQVHFHEVGAVDAIIDICGSVLGLKMLGIEKIYSSPLALGQGQVETAHGAMPVPAPATARLIKGVPVKVTDTQSELTTPTGAAILTTLAAFEDPGVFSPDVVGYGAGSRDLPGLPNMLRAMIGESEFSYDADTLTLLETNLDRLTPENLGVMFDDLLQGGALDVFITPVMMKKNRPAQLLSVLCENHKTEGLARIIFSSGKTLGIRIRSTERLKLPRHQVTVATSGGSVSVKVAEFEGKTLFFPEHDDMVRAMQKGKLAYDDIFFEIQRAMRKE